MINIVLKFKRLLSRVVELPGFEPRITEPKSAVLPLHHSSILVFIIVAVGLLTLVLT